MKTRTCVHLQLWSLVLLACGCTVLAPVTDRSRFYLLASDSAQQSTRTASDPPGKAELAVGLGPVHIPQYLQRAGLATRTEPTRVEYSNVDRWAEPLNDSFPRVLSQDLAHALGTDRVVLFPWNRSLHVSYQVELTVEQFDIDANNQAVLMARWLIKDVKSGQIVYAGNSNQTRAAGTDGASRTAALSQTISAFSCELAAEVRRLREQTSPRVPA
jgi:uncharacterized lipoprotein YmbA